MVIRDRLWQDFDWLLLGAATILSIIGLVEVYSATMSLESGGYFSRQLLFLLVGITLAIIIGLLDYHFLAEQVPILYLGAIGVLIYTLAFGRVVNGSRSWVALGPIGFQPAEFVKIVVVIALARYLSELRVDRYLRLGETSGALLICAAPMGLILAQPDLGTGLTFIALLACGLIIRGVRPVVLVSLVLIVLLMLPFGWFLLKDYQKDRIETFFDPERDPLGAGYHVLQSKIAIGSGGFWGKGLFQGSQNQLGFLPTRQTDFIFSVVGEELGFLGILVCLGLLAFIIFRSITNAQTARDSLGLFLAMGVVAIYVCHVAINAGMVIGLMPITGIPLPFMSYGGSSMLMAFAGLGLIINVRRQRYVN